jgi:uncharacterized protein involved in exopolysaccharide biosynthesis
MGSQAPQLDWPGDDDSAQTARGVTPFHWLQLALGAVRRRKALAAIVFLAGAVASAAYFATRTPVYRVEAKIFAQRPQALPSVVRPLFDDAPGKSAWELVHRRDNLLSIIRQANLAPATATGGRGPSRESVRQWLSRSLAKRKRTAGVEKGPLEGLVLALDSTLVVSSQEGTIDIRIDWPDPQQAYAIVQAATQNFLEARHLQEITAIEEVMSVLQGSAAALHKQLEAMVQDSEKRPVHRQMSARPRQASAELVRLQGVLQAKQRALQDVEDFRQRRLAELHSQLDQVRNTFSDAHPTVIALRQQIESFSHDSGQLESLRAQEAEARNQYVRRAEQEDVALSAASTSPAFEVPAEQPKEDQRIRDLRLQVEQLDARVNAAQVERDAARAAFKFRYNVVWPPQVPTDPYAPNPIKILGAGLIASLALALATAAAPDVLSGRVFERWQVERALDLPVLAETRRR